MSYNWITFILDTQNIKPSLGISSFAWFGIQWPCFYLYHGLPLAGGFPLIFYGWIVHLFSFVLISSLDIELSVCWLSSFVLRYILFLIIIYIFPFLWWLGKLFKYILYIMDLIFCNITSVQNCYYILISCNSSLSHLIFPSHPVAF